MERVNGKVHSLEASVGEIKIRFIRGKNGLPREVMRVREDISIFEDREQVWIPPADYKQLYKKVFKIFSEIR